MDLRSRIWPNRLMETPAAVCTVINMVSVQCFILYCDCYQWNKAWFHENFRLIKEVSILNFLIVVGSAVFAIVYCEISGTAGALILRSGLQHQDEYFYHYARFGDDRTSSSSLQWSTVR
jgi:hypothetical protein